MLPTYPPTVHPATLVEDFMVTVRETKRPYIRVKGSYFGDKSDPKLCPLVLVPSHFFIYPLKKDSKVLVDARESSASTLVLYEVDEDLPPMILDAIEFPADGTIVKAPAAPEVFSSFFLSPDSCFLMGDTMAVHRNGDTFTIFTGDKVITFLPNTGEYSIKSKNFNLELSGGYRILSKGQEVSSNDVTLKELFESVYSFLSDLYSRMAGFEARVYSSPPVPPDTGHLVLTSPAGPVTGSLTFTGAFTPLTGGTPAEKQADIDLEKANKLDPFFTIYE